MLFKFRIWGELRYLSHAETLHMFQQACVRGGVNLCYSEGFNPRPKLSLPLPRSVGIESEEDLLCVKIGADGFDIDEVISKLAKYLPEGCELLGAEVVESKKQMKPCGAVYEIEVVEEYLDEKLKERIEGLLSEKEVIVERRGPKEVKVRQVDVRRFINGISIEGAKIVIDCAVSPGGTIRVDEIIKLLGLDNSKLARAVRRTKIVNSR